MSTSLSESRAHGAPPSPAKLGLQIASLQQAYATGALTPVELVRALYARLQRVPHAGVFTHEVSEAQALTAAEQLMQRKAAGETLPLYGVPFAVKDNIDVAGLATTAACPAFARPAYQNARVVEQLFAHGALLVGKTNLDQFATGLVGVRTPYGIAANPFGASHVPGGSSSGSAVAVAQGFVSFALGTDTAGSGRVPAAFNHIVGLKPTRGMLSAHGLVPACRSLDCVSVFALNVDDAATVARLCAGHDARDPYARAQADCWDPRPGLCPAHFRFGVPRREDLVIGDAPAHRLFDAAVEILQTLGGTPQPIALSPFAQTAALLYDGPFVAERLEATAELLARDPDAIHEVVREILIGARHFSALDAARAHAALHELRAQCAHALRDIDLLVVPSTSIFPTIAQVRSDPVRINSELGRYTNFVNLLDMCALAVPAGLRADGLPFGVTLLAAGGCDALLSSVGRALHARTAQRVGATDEPLHGGEPGHAPPPVSGRARLAVLGAHLSGQPLNHELTQRGARLVCATRTAPVYRLYALDTTPPKPGLVRVPHGAQGHNIELEVWELDHAGFGAFVANIPAPLCIGTIELESGDHVQGFLCEPSGVETATDISHYGGFVAYLRARSS